MIHLARPAHPVPQLYPATLLRRYKRFLADVRLADGRELTLHCPNTGSMRHCVVPESRCWYSESASQNRKYPQTLEVVTAPGGYWAGINTARTNHLVAEALAAGRIAPLRGYAQGRAEVAYGSEQSRIDFLLNHNAQDPRDCYVEVKNVTLREEDGAGYFPDAVSARGAKHLRELIAMVEQGQRALLLFCVQHTGIAEVRPADHIDKLYGVSLRAAQAAGVELLAYGVKLIPEQSVMVLDQPLPVIC